MALGKRQKQIIREYALKVSPNYKCEAYIGRQTACREFGYGYHVNIRVVHREDPADRLVAGMAVIPDFVNAQRKAEEIQLEIDEVIAGTGDVE